MNITILRGELRGEPQPRQLRSGEVVVELDVLVPAADDRPAETVPVVWPSPPSAAAASLRAGEGVVVVGRVRRRFFRSGGVTQSRTEVVGEVVPVRQAARAARAVRAAEASLAAFRAR